MTTANQSQIPPHRTKIPTRRGMNALAPELVSAIVDYAAEFDSTYASYRTRVDTLSSLSLVNRLFREIAQPRLARVVHIRTLALGCHLSFHADFKGRVQTQVWDGVDLVPSRGLEGLLVGFKSLRALRIVECRGFTVTQLHDHQQLTRLSIAKSDIYTSLSGFHKLVLPRLVELSLEMVYEYTSPISFEPLLSPSHFPALRALAMFRFSRKPHFGQQKPSELIPDSLLAQLDCLTADEAALHGSHAVRRPASHPLTVPFLFDLDPHYTTTSWGRSSLAPTCALDKEYVRIRLPCEPIPHRREIEAALFLVETLMRDSTVLRVLYLDLYPRGGTRGYELDNDLRDRIERLMDPKRKKRVEIRWESHEDDVLKSRVSRQFWEQCREEKAGRQR